jgi:hypothetical protein
MKRIFKATIRIRGANPYILVSASHASAIRKGWRKALPVLLRINGRPEDLWRNNMMPVGDGGFYLYLHCNVRKASGPAVGDRVSAEVSFDIKYKGGPPRATPAWFRRALAGEPNSTENWKALTPSRQKGVLRYLMHLKSDEARARNLARIICALSGEHRRFIGSLEERKVAIPKPSTGHLKSGDTRAMGNGPQPGQTRLDNE